MDLQQEINRMVRRAIMEEINGLAIRATLREKIEATGVTGEEIREMIQKTADSYFRSAMDGHVEEKIRSIFDQKVNEEVSREIKAVTHSFTGWDGRDCIRKALNEEVARAIRNGFDVTVNIQPKEEE